MRPLNSPSSDMTIGLDWAIIDSERCVNHSFVGSPHQIMDGTWANTVYQVASTMYMTTRPGFPWLCEDPASSLCQPLNMWLQMWTWRRHFLGLRCGCNPWFSHSIRSEFGFSYISVGFSGSRRPCCAHGRPVDSTVAH